jgi:hypothetical protein
MKSGLTVRADNAVAVLESLRQLSGMDVLVGIPEDKAGREDGSPINNAELGYLHSTGATVEIDGTTVTLPPRPFLDMGIEDSKPRTTAHLKAAATAALEGQQCVSWRAPDRLPVMLQKLLSVLATDCTRFLRKPSNADAPKAFPATSRCMPTVTCCAQLTTS